MVARLKWYRENRTYDIKEIDISLPVNEDAAYIAGLIDGEGSIALHRNHPQICVYNCFEPVMKYLVKTVGGSYRISSLRGRTPNYAWCIGGAKNVFSFIKSLHRFFIIKRKQADKVSAFLASKYGDRIYGRKN